jgi:hypothetical protein
MPPKAVFLAPLYRIQVDEGLSRGEKLDDVLRLTNDKDTIRSLFSHRMVAGIGLVERDAITEAGLVAYAHFEGGRIPTNPQIATDRLAIQLAKLHHFIHLLWLVKDNCASIDNGFMDSVNFVSSRVWSEQ